MITNEGKARQTGSFKRLNTKRESYDKTMKHIGAKEDQGENVSYFFDNFEPGDTRWVTMFWNILPMMIDVVLYLGVMVYLFSLKTTLVAMIMPFSGMTVICSYLMVFHLASFRLKKQKRD